VERERESDTRRRGRRSSANKLRGALYRAAGEGGRGGGLLFFSRGETRDGNRFPRRSRRRIRAAIGQAAF